MIDTDWASAFARDWIEAWNSHDMERILSHYADDFQMSSPLVVERTKRSDGVLQGKECIRAYWEPSLAADPPLEFELIDLLVGIDSITLYYRNVGKRVVAETLIFDRGGLVTRGMSQWAVDLD